MADTVRARLNHYQMLGVSPDATGDEIARAFAREGSVLRPHAFGVLAELCVAYETLRDPIRRRAYDASIGLDRRLKLQSLTAGARQALMAQGPAPAVPLQPAAKAPPPTSQPTFRRSPEPAAKPALPLGPGADRNIRPESRIALGGGEYFLAEAELGLRARPVSLRRTGIVLGTMVVAACALGGMAGWWSSSGVSEAAQPENTVSVALPKAKPVAARPETEIAPEPATEPIVPEARPARPAPVIADVVQPVAAAPELAMEGQPDTGVEPVAAEEPTTEASMPLPNRVIAQTIHRIGYSCGSVASTDPVEGEAPGVFKVTCRSGQIYQARPINGRYRFKRWGKR